MSKPSSVSAKKWVAKPLVSQCGVCGNPADNVKHYGAVSCYSCRAFFRRAIPNANKIQNCTKKTNSCYVDSVSRNKCKKCRYEKCLKVGMKPEKVDRVKKKHLDAKKNDKQNGELDDNQGSVIEDDMFTEKRMNSKSSNFSYSYSDVTDFDISALVEDCVVTEVMQHVGTYEKDNLDLRGSPSFQFTHEEEFKVYELFVRKENLMDGIFQIFQQFPGFVESFEKHLISLCHGDIVNHDFMRIVDQKAFSMVLSMLNGGTLRQCLEMFDEFKNLSEKVKSEALHFSVPVFKVCNRALIKVNMDKEYFVDQHIAAGVYNNTFKKIYETIFPNNRYAVKSVDPLSFHLTSPWALRYEDEVFFSSTLESVGTIVKDDVQLGALYSTLILATPGAKLADSTKNDPTLQRVQGELSLLLFRYLKNKYGDSLVASETTNDLLKLLGDLHICRDIIMFKRLPFSTKELSEASVDEIELTIEDLILNCDDIVV
eukprot:GFUD01037675.1.p1 GENE.GFUD01037675.1~~GFUD01037675.1.p1  ORF type:complete len:484 (-),score=111.17 GFUD01037675.1:15-1466(-)